MWLFSAIWALSLTASGSRVQEMSAPKHREKLDKIDLKIAKKCSGTVEACGDKITGLPGLKELPSFEMYSGYLQVFSHYVHYILYTVRMVTAVYSNHWFFEPLSTNHWLR